MKVLVNLGVPSPGTALHLEPTGVRDDLRQQTLEWIAEDSVRGEAEWTGESAQPLRWALTGESGKPSTFATEILERATGVRRSLAGPQWWCLDDGTSLSDLAKQLTGSEESGRDWSDLHAVLENLPAGRWTTYGDLAARIDTAPQPLGQHLANCPDCSNAYRVLTGSGLVADGFRWSDPSDQRMPREVLEAEGVAFDVTGTADPAMRLTAHELANLLPDNPQ